MGYNPNVPHSPENPNKSVWRKVAKGVAYAGLAAGGAYLGAGLLNKGVFTTGANFLKGNASLGEVAKGVGRTYTQAIERMPGKFGTAGRELSSRARAGWESISNGRAPWGEQFNSSLKTHRNTVASNWNQWHDANLPIHSGPQLTAG